MEELDDIDLTEEEKAMVVANEKTGLITEVACHFCGMRFDFKKTRSLRAHIEEVHVVGEMGFMCGVCCEEFETRKAVENHMSTLHRAPKPFGCGICGETFRLRNLLLKHIDGHSNEEIDNKKAGFCYCGECFEFFETVMSLQAHVVNHREVPIFVCAACGLQTQHRHVMIKHLETHVISNLLTASENKENNIETTNTYFPHHVQIDHTKIESTFSDETSNNTEEPRIQHDGMDTSALDIVNSLSQGNGDNDSIDQSNSTISSNAPVLPEEDANYKCGICDAFFTSLADALTHAGTHQDEEGTMQQVEINVLMEEKTDDGGSAGLDGTLVEQVKTELLSSDSNSMDIV